MLQLDQRNLTLEPRQEDVGDGETSLGVKNFDTTLGSAPRGAAEEDASPSHTVKTEKPKCSNMKRKKSKRNRDFHDEFMDKYDEFSPSWRDQIDR